MVTVCRVLTRLRNIIILALLFFTSISFTQSFINGKIIDSISLKPVEFALIVAYDNNNTPFESASSDSLGNFQIQIPNNVILNYLESQFLGYNQKKILLEDFKVNQNIIFLKSNNNMLDAVDIKADRISNLQTIDKQIFNASQYKNAKGGTALDIIKNLPSISLNAEEALTIRGAKGVVIMLNGRPITVDPNTILSQISAENIENIEVITSPSSKYDPDGLGGIINIKSKLINTDGYSFNVSVNGGLPSIENYDNKKPQQRYGITTSYNYRKDKFDILLGADFLRDDRSGQRIGYVNTLIDDKLTEFPSAGERSLDQTNYALNLSLNYKVSQQSNINLSAYKGQRYQARTADILYNQQRSFIARDRQISPIEYFNNFLASGQNTSDGVILDKQTIYNENLRIRNGDFSFVSLDYTYDFKNSDANLKFSTLYETAQLGGPTDNYNYDGFLKSELYQYQYNSNDNPLDAIRTQIDFNKKIFDLDVDLGIQHRFTMHPGEFIFEELDIARNTLFLVPEFTNRIDLSRNIWSSYFQASGNKQKLKYTFGLRAEITNRTVEIRNPKNTFNFDTLNFFPNLAVDYQVNDAWNIKFGANKRIQRNTTNMLTPFPEREHSETLEQGDAMLVPEYITNFELTVQYKGKNSNVYSTLYNRNINNIINRVNNIYNDTILNRIYTNAGKATIYGIEVGSTVKFTNKVKANFGANLYNYAINGTLFNTNINTSNWQYNINSSIDFVLPYQINTQLSINYLSERITAQGVDSRFYNPNLSISKVINKRLNIFANWNNIDMGLLKSNEQAIDTWQNNFYTHTNYIYEVDVIKVGISYKMNQFGNNKFRKGEFGDQEF